MCQLPRTHNDSVALTERMISGFTEHPDTFPSGDIEKLETALENFDSAKKAFNDAFAAYAVMGERQKQAFTQLQTVLANQVKLAQVDTADSPVKLGLIGFGPRRKKSSINLPNQPQLLDAKPVAPGVVRLFWQKSVDRNAGAVRNFIIESRILNGSAGNWLLAGTSFECEAVLKDQPKDIKLEYRVIAANRSGRSCTSNVLAVVL